MQQLIKYSDLEGFEGMKYEEPTDLHEEDADTGGWVAVHVDGHQESCYHDNSHHDDDAGQETCTTFSSALSISCYTVKIMTKH